jgi:hypothetical protein
VEYRLYVFKRILGWEVKRDVLPSDYLAGGLSKSFHVAFRWANILGWE